MSVLDGTDGFTQYFKMGVFKMALKNEYLQKVYEKWR